MKSELLVAASKVIPDQGILVNMVSRRVRQLAFGHRALIEFVPGMGAADIALTEIAQEKLTFESTPGENGTKDVGQVMAFPGVPAGARRAA